MNKLKEYLESNILITDGAMGTYFKSLRPDADYPCELGCLYDEELVTEIHKKYIDAGARLIRTNTFSANTASLGNFETVERVIKKAVDAAKKAVGVTDTFIGASIGPAAETEITDEHKKTADIFLEKGIDIFVFETFNNYSRFDEIIDYIKAKNPDAFIIIQFALTDVGVTKKSVYAESLIENLKDKADALGFNCGVGPMHMLNIVKRLKEKPAYLTALPNAGYPEIIDGKTEYVMNPKYFAKMVCDIAGLGAKIVGGCCGTTPEHIRLLARELDGSEDKAKNTEDTAPLLKKSMKPLREGKNSFHQRLDKNEFIIAVELDPPFKTDTQKLIKGAQYLKEKGVDIITIADSPMGKARADSVIISSKIYRETGINVLPHICCRDRNAIALRSAVLGAYIEGIRSFLIVTGDPVPIDERLNTKSVFNLNSYSFVSMVREMNESVFDGDKVKIGCAVNFNVKNKDSELKRLLKKRECGAEFFLTQPIFTDDTAEYLKSIGKNRDYKILGGIMPLVSYKNAEFINNELPGITIPEEYVSRFSPEMSREEAQETGIELAVELAEKIKPYVDGFYLTAPFNRYEMVGEIVQRLGTA